VPIRQALLPMTASLPNPSQIAKLPLRAIVAYASRAAYRVLTRQDVGYTECCENTLRAANDFVQSSSVTTDVARRAAAAAADVAGAEALDESGRDLRVGLSVRAAARCCYYAVNAAISAGAERASYLETAANDALRAARQLDDPLALRLAVTDYRLLVKLFGEHATVVLGEPGSREPVAGPQPPKNRA